MQKHLIRSGGQPAYLVPHWRSRWRNHLPQVPRPRSHWRSSQRPPGSSPLLRQGASPWPLPQLQQQMRDPLLVLPAPPPLPTRSPSAHLPCEGPYHRKMYIP